MKKPGACYLGLLVGLLVATTPVPAELHRLPDPAETVIKTCADFDIGSPYELTGTTTVLGTVSCSPRVVVHVKEADAVLRSDKTLETHGLHVVVHREAKLTIAAPAVNMQRAKDDAKKGTLLIVKGQLNFEVTGWTPAFLSATTDDTSTAIKVGPKGAISCDQAIRFTEASVVVAKPISHEGVNDQAGDPISVTRSLLEELPSTTSKPDETGTTAATAAVSPPTQDDSPAPADVDGDETNRAFSPLSTIPEEDGTAADTMSGADPADKQAADTVPGADPADKHTSTVTAGAASSSPPVEDSGTVISSSGGTTNGSNDGETSNSDSGTSERSTDDADPDGPSDYNPVFRVRNAGVNKKERVAAARTGNNGGNGVEAVVPPFPMPHLEPSLRVGQTLAGRLFSPDETAAIFVSPVSGCIRHARSTGDAPVDAKGRPTGPAPEEVTTLVVSITKKVDRVYQLRLANTAEQERLRRSSKLAAVRKWLPFGKHGFMEERARRRSKEHMKEVYITVTDRGRVEVSMDGIIVLRISGPSFFGYRSRDSTYELRATRKGLAVFRGGELDWSLDGLFT